MTEATQVERVARAMSDAEPVAWKCQERSMGAWYTRYVDERPTGERYRNIVPLYAHPPAAEPVGLREAVEGIDDDYMTSEKHHPGYVLIPTAKFEQIVSAAERAKEIVPPYYVNWHAAADKALATPARTDDAGLLMHNDDCEAMQRPRADCTCCPAPAPQPHTAPMPHEVAPQGRDEVERLREALRPFANRADKIDGKWLDHETHWSPAYGSTEITIGDLRRARAALSPPLS